ncbi:MAG: hypothetical protein GF419_01435 [Ignavibacteriales bacterium]|nr:hypothetical protein [Ignavibacteriales bacterium]
MELIEILTGVLLLALTALSVFTIVYMGRATKAIEKIEKDVTKLVDESAPAIESLRQSSDQLNELVESAKDQVDKTRWIVDEVVARAKKVFDFERRVAEKVDSPAPSIVNNLHAVRDGLSSFWNAMKR